MERVLEVSNDTRVPHIIADWVLAVGQAFDTRERRPDAHCEALGEVYLNVLTELNRVGLANVRFPERFVRNVARAEFRRAHWRERE